MKINKATSPLGSIDKLGIDDKKNIHNLQGTDFHTRYKDFEKANVLSYLSDLAQRIDEQGKRFGKSFSFNELKYYKKLLGEFLQTATSAAYAFDLDKSRDKRGKLKVYALVKKINDKVDELVKGFLDEEISRIDLLKMIDEIRGIIIDILM